MTDRDPETASPSDTDVVNAILGDLEGTLIRDLRSMMKWAREFDVQKKADPAFADLGALNFTLMMVALIGCETLGFYTEGAQKHVAAVSHNNPPLASAGWRGLVRRLLRCRPLQASHGHRLPDPGVYLMLFVQSFFAQGSEFKHLVKVLADELRHDLVHGFGSVGRPPGVRLALFVDRNTGVQIRVGKLAGIETIAINSIAFAEQFIAAFSRVSDLISAGSDVALTRRMATAARLQLPIIQGVQNQFNAAYNRAVRRGLPTLGH